MSDPRIPTEVLVIDANILVSAALGVRTRVTMARVGLQRTLVTSREAASEALLVAQNQRNRTPFALDDLLEILDAIEVIAVEKYEAMIADAAAVLQNAVASRNGSTADAHVLALAWTCESHIWSHDRDFAGTGWPSWSSANLAAALSKEAPASATHP
ncbi:PIN domain-containing protein [Bosea sp. PAMC 26642]|uniref:PIN domain-containing protein n=1 Tax=Bosea sp. (strain PAMC 26642) TaxID=1792307 RepID=UPI00076FF75D|nr:PIN domain-containing protein [Bosea sp. PAMC 26642]AMJ59535.1 hypothetical protein AXW83_03755 [Bosea sp. PAMC 26642]